jgi:hypothetical protein
MDLQAKQKEFDDVKWYDSILVGEDCCGSYDFCDKCNKYELYPCAKAMQRKSKKYIRIAIVIRRKKR